MSLRPPLLRITMILGALHAVLGYLLLPALHIGLAGLLLGGAVLLASTMLMPMTIFSRALTNDTRLADRLSWAGSLCMGFFSSLFVLAVLRELLMLYPPARLHAQASAIAVIVPGPAGHHHRFHQRTQDRARQGRQGRHRRPAAGAGGLYHRPAERHPRRRHHQARLGRGDGETRQ